MGGFQGGHAIYQLAGAIIRFHPPYFLVLGLIESAQVIIFFRGCLSDPVRICAATINGHEDIRFSGVHTPYCRAVPAINNPIFEVSRHFWLTVIKWLLEK
jgi:hypothetical protein